MQSKYVMAVLLMGSVSGDLYAQQPAERQKRTSRLLEEVIVTAQRREENSKDVPISISAYSADFLAAKGVTAQQDLPKITPGLNIGNPVGFATAYLRGIGSDAFMLADPLVVTYIDGVYFPASTTQFQDFGDVERIEIDKGPQGTLFGRNALGGVIAVTSKTPSLEEVEGSLKAGYTDYAGSDRYAWRASGFVSVPLTDTLALSLAVLESYADPYYEHYHGPQNNRRLVPAATGRARRVKLLWQPVDNIQVKFNYYYSFTDAPDRQFGVNTDPSLLAGDPSGGANLLVPTQDPYGRAEVDAIMHSWDRTRNFFGSVDWQTELADLQFIASKQSILAVRNADFDASPLPVAYFENLDAKGYKEPFFSDGQSLELRVLSNDSAPEWIEVVAGLYLYTQESGVGGANFSAAGTDLSLGQVAGFVIPGLTEIYDNILSPLGLNPTGINLALKGGLDEESRSAYFQSTLFFSDAWSMTVGARYQEIDRGVLFAYQGFFIDSDTQIPIAQYDQSDPQYRTSYYSLDPKLTFSYRPPSSTLLGEDPLLYLSYQVASIGNTFNAISLIDPPSFTKASKLTAYEAGIKTFLFGGVSNFNAAVFWYVQDDPQIQVVSLQTGGAVRFENAQELETVGAEFSIVTPIFPSLTNDGLVFTMGAAYLDAVYNSYTNASGFDPDTGLYSQSNDYSGNEVVQAPKLTGNVGLNQTINFDHGSWDIGVDYYYNSGFYFAAQNTPNTEISQYATLAFNTSYIYEPWQLRVSFFGKNILDEEYLSARFINDFGVTDYGAQRSSYGVNLDWEF